MIVVLDRVTERHPNLSKADVRMAWRYAAVGVPRYRGRPFEYLAVGCDGKGRILEMTGRRDVWTGDWIIWHAMTPPSVQTLREIGMRR